jgi:hypothetical protein
MFNSMSNQVQNTCWRVMLDGCWIIVQTSTAPAVAPHITTNAISEIRICFLPRLSLHPMDDATLVLFIPPCEHRFHCTKQFIWQNMLNFGYWKHNIVSVWVRATTQQLSVVCAINCIYRIHCSLVQVVVMTQLHGTVARMRVTLWNRGHLSHVLFIKGLHVLVPSVFQVIIDESSRVRATTQQLSVVCAINCIYRIHCSLVQVAWHFGNDSQQAQPQSSTPMEAVQSCKQTIE